MMEMIEESVDKKALFDGYLLDLKRSDDAIYGVLLSSTDGHELAVYSSVEFSASKMAAMTSSCLALSEKMAQESLQNHCEVVIIQNENGYITLKRLGKKLVLSAMAKRSINLGMLLSAVRSTADKFEGSMRQQS